MLIQHNISALRTYNKVNTNTTKSSKVLEKLSSGYKINRASDDSAGISISKKMRAQIRGLNMAGKNIQDGISLIQVAEGGLNEIHSYLQRARELSIQSANDTNTDNDCLLIQKEIEQIKSGINEIANNTEFNTKKLLNVNSGNIQPIQSSFTVTGTGTTKHTIDSGWINFGLDADKPHLIKLNEGESVVDDPSKWLFTKFSISISYDGTGMPTGLNIYSSPDGYTITHENPSLVFSYNGMTIDVSHKRLSGGGAGGTQHQGNVSLNTGVNNLPPITPSEDSLLIQVGANSNQSTKIELSDVTVSKLGLDNINVSNRLDAEQSISTIDNAIRLVSNERSKYGAYQNRLEHTYNSVMNTSENLTSAESLIRDADMAKEMMNFTKQNILLQVSQSILSQSNQQSQSVLSLLN